MPFNRILKLAEIIAESGDIIAFNRLCVHFDSYIKKYSHFEPNDDDIPSVWRKNLDYGESPYFGSISEFMEKFPGGLKDWIIWRDKNKKNRYKEYSIKERKANLEDFYNLIECCDNCLNNRAKRIKCIDFLMKNAYKESQEFKSINDLIKEKEEQGFSADDAKTSAVKDFIEYWKKLRKK